MHWRGVPWILGLIGRGEFDLLWSEVWSRFYRFCWTVIFRLRQVFHKSGLHPLDGQVKVETKHPVAYESPDHQNPWGTKYDNSTNRKFVLHMAKLIADGNKSGQYAFLDIGCSGGQLVKDFRDLGWLAVGLEGSDYSLKHRRANWPELANRNLFTCDVTRDYRILANQQPAQFDLVTAWEVIEHIHPDDLRALFGGLDTHLKKGGLFVASTTSWSSMCDGVELHQSRFTNDEWRRRIAEICPSWEPFDLGFKYYQYVRFHYYERSFLCYRKR